MHVLNLRIGREFRFGGDRRIALDFDVFNIPNAGRYQAFLSGANHLFSANYGRGREVQSPRAAQIGLRVMF